MPWAFFLTGPQSSTVFGNDVFGTCRSRAFIDADSEILWPWVSRGQLDVEIYDVVGEQISTANKLLTLGGPYEGRNLENPLSAWWR